jgi:hypothetical protein
LAADPSVKTGRFGVFKGFYGFMMGPTTDFFHRFWTQSDINILTANIISWLATPPPPERKNLHA